MQQCPLAAPEGAPLPLVQTKIVLSTIASRTMFSELWERAHFAEPAENAQTSDSSLANTGWLSELKLGWLSTFRSGFWSADLPLDQRDLQDVRGRSDLHERLVGQLRERLHLRDRLARLDRLDRLDLRDLLDLRLLLDPRDLRDLHNLLDLRNLLDQSARRERRHLRERLARQLHDRSDLRKRLIGQLRDRLDQSELLAPSDRRDLLHLLEQLAGQLRDLRELLGQRDGLERLDLLARLDRLTEQLRERLGFLAGLDQLDLRNLRDQLDHFEELERRELRERLDGQADTWTVSPSSSESPQHAPLYRFTGTRHLEKEALCGFAVQCSVTKYGQEQSLLLVTPGIVGVEFVLTPTDSPQGDRENPSRPWVRPLLVHADSSEPLGANGDPFSTVLSRYAELQRRSEEDFAGLESLAREFAALPDGAILYGTVCLRQGDLDKAALYFTLAVARGLPVYTEGLRLLHEGLNTLHDLMPERVANAREGVNAVAAHADWDSPTLSLLL